MKIPATSFHFEALYVKYLEGQQVGIDTLYDRPRALQYVGELIKAFKTEVKPLLDNVSIDQLTLHTFVDGLETQLEPDGLISDINAGHSARTALIIKKQDTFLKTSTKIGIVA